MAATVSGLYLLNIIDKFDATQLATDLSLTTNKTALFTSAITAPNFSSDTAYGVAPYNANEVPNGSGYTTGGLAVASPTVTESPTGTLMWDHADDSWAASTFTNVQFALAYADALAGNNAIVGIYLGGTFNTVSGIFLIQYAATGVVTIDLTP